MSPILMSNLELLQLILDGTGFSSDLSQLGIHVHVHYSVNLHTCITLHKSVNLYLLLEFLAFILGFALLDEQHREEVSQHVAT